ncbi:MAG TPA: patatin-like phospholipase family protein, partial [Thermoanaerobaculia bacterium]|nr:patatin-like phospholipase family protein [Thermoanaerobaculia bacterium]
QVGLLKGLARRFPNLRFQIITGVSAGAINAALLASKPGTLADKAKLLSELWSALECHHIFRFDMRALVPFRSALASLFPRRRWSRPLGLVDTSPLAELLRDLLQARPCQPIDGIAENIRTGDLKAFSLMTLDYSTGQSVRWVQGQEADVFEEPNKRAVQTHITLEHVLASAALPFVFPAVKIGDRWHGDGGIRLAAPLSPAVHLGARRILAMSTGYQRTPDELTRPVVHGYPPAAQILGQLVNAVFLDVIDEDVARMERMNEMLRKLEPRERNGFKAIDLCVLRPSQDLGRLASEYERYLPRNIKMVTRALGAKETESPDFVSLLMFEPNYLSRLIEIGEHDIDSRLDELSAFFGLEVQAAAG